MIRLHFVSLQGREAESAGGAARREECAVVVPLKRRATQQRTGRFASRPGLCAQARSTSLRPLPMTHKKRAAECPWALAQNELGIGRGPRLVSEHVRANAALGGIRDGV